MRDSAFREVILDLVSDPNPVQAWLKRVAVECGSPFKMEVEAHFVRNENARKLIVNYAIAWARKRELQNRA